MGWQMGWVRQREMQTAKPMEKHSVMVRQKEKLMVKPKVMHWVKDWRMVRLKARLKGLPKG